MRCKIWRYERLPYYILSKNKSLSEWWSAALTYFTIFECQFYLYALFFFLIMSDYFPPEIKQYFTINWKRLKIVVQFSFYRLNNIKVQLLFLIRIQIIFPLTFINNLWKASVKVNLQISLQMLNKTQLHYNFFFIEWFKIVESSYVCYDL